MLIVRFHKRNTFLQGHVGFCMCRGKKRIRASALKLISGLLAFYIPIHVMSTICGRFSSYFRISNRLTKFFEYTKLLSDKWNLTVNVDKTKSMIFNKAGIKFTRESFLYKNNRIDLGMEYKYLGIIFKPSGIFTNAVEVSCKKATKSLF